MPTFIVRTTANELYEVETTDLPNGFADACAAVNRLSPGAVVAHSSWLKENTGFAARRHLKRVLRGEYIVLSALKREERVCARHYHDVAERMAFRAGYDIGFKQGEAYMGAADFPNAYSAGYWDGRADGAEHFINHTREPGTITWQPQESKS